MGSSTVWKFQLRLGDQDIISMPKGARLLHVAMQHHSLCVWALVDPVAPLVRRGFRIAGTGHPIDGNDCKNHVSTVFDGPFVWHVFDIGEEPAP